MSKLVAACSVLTGRQVERRGLGPRRPGLGALPLWRRAPSGTPSRPQGAVAGVDGGARGRQAAGLVGRAVLRPRHRPVPRPRQRGLVNASSPASIDRCVAAAAAAQAQWAQTTFAQRRAVLRTLMRHVLDAAHDICRVAALDSGKTMADAHLGEILVTVERIQWTLAHGEAALRP